MAGFLPPNVDEERLHRLVQAYLAELNERGVESDYSYEDLYELLRTGRIDMEMPFFRATCWALGIRPKLYDVQLFIRTKGPVAP